ncbi:ionotropic receptor 75a-like [Achroia grisella]|uniref:ionotropic receptor 75a-like n=1 Tax=Achroia grisella TaxID=688607 RepID=UPI0027D2585D|nr:ionotropic receptor 75a-like [Achroia grisella]
MTTDSMALTPSRLEEETARSPCLSENENISAKMLATKRRVLLDVLMACWGMGTWLGINGLYVQLPLLVERLPEGWALPASMTVAVQIANIGLLLYALFRRIFTMVKDAAYIYALLIIGALALLLNAFLYTETAMVGQTERSVAFLSLTFFAGLVGCTSSVLFYPYLRYFRDIYLATYLVGEGLSGFIPSILSLIQGVGGEPECVPYGDNSTIPIYPPARFDSTVFMLILAVLAIISFVSFTIIDSTKIFESERVSPTAAVKDEEAVQQFSLSHPKWLSTLLLMACLNALSNGVLPSIQSYSCMPYGTRAYHLAVALGTSANPMACLAGVWLRPVPAKALAAMLSVAVVPFTFILTTALMSPSPPLQHQAGGEALVVLSWVCVLAIVSYARMWVYGWARAGGARGMRACGVSTQIGSALGSLLLFSLVNYTSLFTQPDVCPTVIMDINFIFTFFATKNIEFLSMFLCWSPADILKLYHEASRWGFRLRIGNLEKVPELPAYDIYREGVFLDVGCHNFDHLLNEASATRAFNHRYTWLLFHDSPYNKSTVEKNLINSTILPDADVIWSTPDAMVDVYKVKEDLPLITTDLGLEKTRDLMELKTVWSQQPTAVTRRRDLGNIFLKSATLISQPQHFKGWSDLTKRHIDTFPKLTYPIMNLCAEDLHFRHNMKQVDLYGEERNGTFNGLAGLLQRNDVEIGITSMFMRQDRLRILHYCSETAELRGAFIFRQPSQSAVSNVFLLPFSDGVWWASFAMTMAMAALLAALGYTLHKADPELALLTPFEALSFAIGTACQQGFYRTPNLMSARLVMFCSLLMALFTFTAYSAKIVVILQTPSDAIQTISDLAKSPMTLGVQETTYKRVYFAESSDPATIDLYRRKLLPNGDRAYLSVDDGIARMRTGLFAFQVEQSSGYDIISKTFTEREKCGLKEVQAFRLPMVSVPIRKHSGYRDLLASRLRWQREVGLINREQRHWLAERPRCDAAGAGFLSVGIADILPAIQVLSAGALISVLLLLSEIVNYKMRRTGMKNIQNCFNICHFRKNTTSGVCMCRQLSTKPLNIFSKWFLNFQVKS